MSATTPTPAIERRRRTRRSIAALVTSIAVAASSLIGMATVASAEGTYTLSGTAYVGDLDLGSREAGAADQIGVEVWQIDTGDLSYSLYDTVLVGDVDENGDNWSMQVPDGDFVVSFGGPGGSGLLPAWRGYTSSYSTLQEVLDASDWISPGFLLEWELVDLDATLPLMDDPGPGLTISGTVSVTLDNDTVVQAGLDEVAVTAWSIESDEFGVYVTPGTPVFTVDAAEGADNWTMSGLAEGSYLLQFEYRGNQSNVADAFLGGAYRADEERFDNNFIIVGEGYTADAFDTTLLQGAVISGSVKTNAGTNLSGQDVVVWRETVASDGSPYFEQVATATTNAGGTYTVRELPPGAYAVELGGRNNYLSEFWEDEPLIASAEEAYAAHPIDLVVDQVRPGIDARLTIGSKISGTVKNTAGAALRNVVVTAYRGGSQGIQEISSATTSSTGSYTLTGLAAGSYLVGYTPPTTGTTIYLPEFYNNKIYDFQATPIAVAAGATKTGVNVVLDRAASIAGTISFPPSATDDPDPQQAYVVACKKDAQYEYVDCSGNVGNGSEVAENGTYRITGLRAGSYTVFVTYAGDENYKNEYFSNAETTDDATFFSVSTGAAVTGKNVQLDPGATVTGTVRSPEGAGLAGIRVSLFGYTNGFIDYSVESTQYTDGDGNYVITGLNSGEFIGLADPFGAEVGGEYPRRYLGGEYSDNEADPITVSSPDTLTGQDIQFENPVTISGTVRAESSGLPLEGMDVTVHRFPQEGSLRSDETGTATTDSNGEYSVSGLPPGTYSVEASAPFWSSADTAYLREWLGSATGKRLATKVAVSSGTTTVDDIELNLAGRLTGRVVDTEGTPLAGITVNESNLGTLTAEDGTFTVGGFNPGPTYLQIGPSDYSTEPSPYVTRSIDGPAVTTDAEPVDVGDIVLERESFIEGVVVGRTGSALANVYVSAERIDGALPNVSFENDTETDASGRFTLDSLPTGTYLLRFAPTTASSAYPSQFLGGARDRALSETIAIVSEGSTRFVEARLYTGGTVQGVVKNSVTGAALPGLSVDVSWGDDEFGQYQRATTNSKGAYVLPGLEAGSYDLTINTRSSSTGTGFQRTTQQIFLPANGSLTRNASLVPTTRVTGKVTSGGSGVNDVTVIAQRVVNGVVQEGYIEPLVTSASTDALGNYTLRLERGTYIIKVLDDSQRYPVTYFGGATDPAAATPVTVSSTTTITGRNIALPTNTGAIDADVLDDELTGCVALDRVEGGEVLWSLTPGTSVLGDPCVLSPTLDDIFPIENLPAGTYDLRIFADGEWDGYELASYDLLEFTGIVVTAGATTVLDGDPGTGGDQPLDFGEPSVVEYVTTPEVVEGSEPELEAAFGYAVGETVTVTEGVWADPIGAIEYRWLRDGRRITGATGSSYTLAPGDAGTRISVQVRVSPAAYPEYLDLGYTTAQSPVVELGDAPTLSVAPTVTGALRVGQVLTAKPGTWSIDRLTYSYEWVRSTNSGDPVVVSRASTYKLVTADVSASSTAPQLTLRVTASRTGFASATEELPIGTIVPAVAMVQTTKSTVTAVSGGYRVTAGAWSPSGATYTFGWRLYLADGSYTEHAGVNTATSSTLTTPEVIGTPGRIVATVTAARAGYTTTTVIVPVRSGPQVTIDTPPSIIGTPKVGFALAVDTESMQTTPTTATLTYQWLRNGAAITGATKSTYVPTTTDVGRTISVRITAVASGYPTSAATILTGVVILPVEPFVQGTTTIEGTPSVGRLLRVVTAGWEPTPTSYTYQWRRNNVAITGATLSSYRLVSTDLGKTITVTVVAKRAGYANVTVAPAPSAGVITALGPVSVSGVSAGASARVGSALTASVGTWDVTPTSYTYQWTRNGEPIVGATASTYTPLVSDLGDEIGVTVVARKTGYPNSTPTASPTLTVGLGAAVSASGLPLLKKGTTTVTSVTSGDTLLATPGTWPAVALDLRYQWQINRADGNGWVDLEGLDTKSLDIDEETIPGLTVGHSLRVVVTAARAGYLDSPPAVSASAVVR